MKMIKDLIKTKKLQIIVISLVYTIFYLFAARDIRITSSGSFQFLGVENAFHRMFRQKSSFQFEPIYQIIYPPVNILISPINILIGFILGLLISINVILFFKLRNMNKSCRIRDSSGLVASIIALVSGTACCGPVLLLILGLQASGLIVSIFQTAIPISFLLLIVGIFLLKRNIEES